ncbi:MAG TPA: N-acetyltransferase [bacterium]|nr:N-acetyltransferase [bacterium]
MSREKISIRKARITDSNYIKNLVNRYADEGVMLPISINQIYERLRNFSVLEKNGHIIGCGALKIVWKDLGEIRSVAIARSQKKKGYGRILIKELLEEAKSIDLKKVFVLTYVPSFFEKLGFKKISKSKLPHKVWIDCINCPKFPRCDEIAMQIELEK